MLTDPNSPLILWGLLVVEAVQTVSGPVTDPMFRLFSMMGEAEFFLLFIPAILWCIDYRLGARLAVLVILSAYLNSALKDAFDAPRPFHIDPSLGLSTPSGGGIPSGHAQTGIVVWGALAAYFAKPWIWAAAVAMIILIGLSRIYLGVHFPHDVLFGWLIGGIVLISVLVFERPVSRWLVGLRLPWQVAIVTLLPVVPLLLYPDRNAAISMGGLSGLALGMLLARGRFDLAAKSGSRNLVLRYALGTGVLFLLYSGIYSVIPGEESALYLYTRYALFWVMGVWATLGAPWLFAVTRIAGWGTGRVPLKPPIPEEYTIESEPEREPEREPESESGPERKPDS